MNKAAKVGLGVVALIIIVISAFYVHVRMAQMTDEKACPTVLPFQASQAVINDVIRPSNQLFAKHHLTANDVSVDIKGIQIGPSSVLVPFHISKEPQKQYFGMPRCAVLSNVEYASD
ncbi:hypothetical protein [Pantoea sp.]|uniref:hypothetical protein n=1 Tax=Pantoea sp. TaxID=69393 RepID=UPI002909D550|nr:hypothetical protein [Pantoea sp.]MDU4125760.1 hypothetical protein [Pantoea sp.]